MFVIMENITKHPV